MFGYHDSSHCAFDIWSPNPTRWGDNAIENRAFSAFCKHQQECDDIVNGILNGQTDFDLDDRFDQSDLDYIEAQCQKHGISVSFSIS